MNKDLKHAARWFFQFFLPIVVMVFLYGCYMTGCAENKTVDHPDIQQRISSFEQIEKEIDAVRRDVQYPAAKDRIYYGLFHERNEILNIAEGKIFSDSKLTNQEIAIIRKIAWMVLGELQERRPEFEIIIQKEEEPKEPVHPDVEKLPEEFK